MTDFKITTMLQRYLKKWKDKKKKNEIITGRSGAAGLWLKVQSYVHSGHDLRHERLRVGASAGISAKLMQASLALAAPKIQMRYARSK